MKFCISFFFLVASFGLKINAQVIPPPQSRIDSLRIINYTTAFSQHIDSQVVYHFNINRDSSGYYWYLKNAPVGLTIHKDDGTLNFKAAKNYFLSGKLKYDYVYTVGLGVKSLDDPAIKIDTSFTITFYNTEIIPSHLKPSVSGTVNIEEGEKLSFRLQCETGTFPFENIFFSSSTPLDNYSPVKDCNDEFSWTPGYDFIKETNQNKEKSVTLTFIAATRYAARDTAVVKVVVKNALNYPHALVEFELVNKNIRSYILQLKYAFQQLDKKLKNTKTTRTIFDLTSASTALTGTILNTSSDASAKKTGQILPGIGIALVPIKEATAPNKTIEQNQASQIRSAIRRLEYLLTDNVLVGDRDEEITRKTNRLKDELKQAQIQLIDIPVDLNNDMSEAELDRYFNNPKVNKKYRVKRRK
ncbi:MAG: hypothetical protein ABIT96_11085 [Ferruginibacter sp.]